MSARPVGRPARKRVEGVRPGAGQGAAGHRARDRAGEFILLIGPLRLRQVDAASHRRRPDPAERRRGRRERKSAHQARPDRDHDRFPGRCPLRLADGREEHRPAARNHALGSPRRIERVRELVELVELRGFESHHPWQLSSSGWCMVSIARALAFGLALLMDEPFGALDEMTRERLNLELLRIWSRAAARSSSSPTRSPRRPSSTRVVVMSARPGRIVGVDVDLPQPRGIETREEPRSPS